MRSKVEMQNASESGSNFNLITFLHSMLKQVVSMAALGKQ